MSGVVTHRPGRRVVMPLRRSVGAPLARPGGDLLPRLFGWTVLVSTLPLFAQTFYYLNELPPPYLLSKAWPIITAPLTLYAVTRMHLPAKHIYLVLFAYTIGFTPLISMVQLGNGFVDALTTTVKIWPFSFYFGLSALLYWLAPPDERLRRACLALGIGTFVLMVVLWFTIPTRWYTSDPSEGKLLLYEVERGYRIYMPLFFGFLLMFYLVRRFMRSPSLWPALGLLVAFVLLLSIYKQRTFIAGAVLVCGYGALASMPRVPRRLVLGLGLLVLPGAVALLFWKLNAGGGDAFGSSLSVRNTSFALATGFLGDDAWRWILGVGATTRFGAVTLADIFGNDQFYVADLGWVGVVFEYGLVGAVLIAAVYAWGYFVTVKAAARVRTPFSEALSDYVLFMIVSSSVYSLVFTPGELGVIMAIAVYLDHARDRRVPVPRGNVLRPSNS
ncbi:hypothetical protein [Xanthobacter pseudotagetidis]|uniref:hypothetical protein n=1 Tax=Xanthobacter pseudotagetidis TaxID=3119911 RepID=UPI003729A6D0